MADTAEQSVSLRDDLSKIYDQQANETNEPEVETPAVEATEEKPERVRDESGRFVKAVSNDERDEEQPEAPVENEEAPEAKPEVKPEPGLEAPHHWSAEDKAAFTKLPKEGQEFMLRRHKAMEADYTRKTQEVADVKRFKDGFDQLFTPHRNFFAMNGLDDVGAVRYMLGWFSSLQQNPAQTISSLAQTYGIDLNQKQAENADPNVQSLHEKIRFLESQIAQTNQAQQYQVSSNLLQQVNSFRDEKDSTGNLKHPHFETVRKDMSVLVESGRAQTMEEAYELAVRLHPDIHDKQLQQTFQQQQEAARKKDQDEAAKKAAQAKKAATGIRSGSASVEKQSPRTLRDHLSAIYDRQASS